MPLSNVGEWFEMNDPPQPPRRVAPIYDRPAPSETYSPLLLAVLPAPELFAASQPAWPQPRRHRRQYVPDWQPDPTPLWVDAEVVENEYLAPFMLQTPALPPRPNVRTVARTETFWAPAFFDNLVAPGNATISGLLAQSSTGSNASLPPIDLATRRRDWPRLRHQNQPLIYLEIEDLVRGSGWMGQPATTRRQPSRVAYTASQESIPLDAPLLPTPATLLLSWHATAATPQRTRRTLPPPTEAPPTVTITLLSDDVNVWGWATPVAQRPRSNPVPVWSDASPAMPTVQTAVDTDIDRLSRVSWMVQSPGPPRSSGGRSSAAASAAATSASETATTPIVAIPPSLTGDFGWLLWSVPTQTYRARPGHTVSAWAPSYFEPWGPLAVPGPYCVSETEVYQAGSVVSSVVCGGPVTPAAVLLRFVQQDRARRRSVYLTSVDGYPWRVPLS